MHGSLPAWTTHAITDITSRRTAQFDVNGAARQFRNTNRMVGRKGWHILLSKTGYTREAGRCLTMLFEEAGRKVLVVPMGADDGADRALDALAIKRWLAREFRPAKGAAAGRGAVNPAARLRRWLLRPSSGPSS